MYYQMCLGYETPDNLLKVGEYFVLSKKQLSVAIIFAAMHILYYQFQFFL